MGRHFLGLLETKKREGFAFGWKKNKSRGDSEGFVLVSGWLGGLLSSLSLSLQTILSSSTGLLALFFFVLSASECFIHDVSFLRHGIFLS